MSREREGVVRRRIRVGVAMVAVVLALAATGCASLHVLEAPKICKSGDACSVAVDLKSFDPQKVDACVLAVSAATVRAAGGVVVTWSLPSDVTKVLRFKPVDPASLSTDGAGIDIFDDRGRQDFIEPFTDGTVFTWRANPAGGSKVDRHYRVNVVLRYLGTDFPCKLDPIIVNEG